MLSCRRGRQNERNVCLIGVGHISVALPHHPVRLHGVMQRQAKRISSTVSELLRGSPAARTHLNPWTVPDLNSSSTSRIVTTPTTGSTTTTASDVTAHLKANRPTQQSNEAHTVLFSNSAEPVIGKPSHTALIFNVLAVSQGLTVNVSLHPSLSAIYQINPVYFSGQLGPRGYVEINLTDHSLSLQSVHHSESFPRSIKISLPRILTTVLRRESFGGRYSRGQRRQPMLTQGLTAEQGLYWHVQVKVDTLEQTLSTDMLNYIVVVGRLFMKEINEVIQKMAGDEQRSCASRPRSRLFPSTLTVTDSYAAAENGWLLSRAARGKTKFTIRIRLEEIQLMATTRSGAVKLEAKIIDVELTNRVCQASLDSCFLPCRESVCRHDPRKSVINLSKRPSNLGLPTVTCPLDHPGSFTFSGTGNPLFIYSSVAKVCAELGYLDQVLAPI
ncbi:hypothetical protein AHF37_03389 [Paragonimus kellicotti]|nr:hypothetical protein AHF37_03389 [Paragonimus kellicotti]